MSSSGHHTLTITHSVNLLFSVKCPPFCRISPPTPLPLGIINFQFPLFSCNIQAVNPFTWNSILTFFILDISNTGQYRVQNPEY